MPFKQKHALLMDSEHHLVFSNVHRAHVSATDINSEEGKKEGKESVPQTHFYHATPLLTNQQWLLITY